MATGQVSPKRGKVVDIPNVAPTIGTATDAGTGTGADVAFTAPTVTTGGPIFYYKATSNPGSVTGTASSSPVRVNSLTQGTSYTFTVVGVNGTGEGPSSAASNSVIPFLPNSFESIATTTLGSNSTTVTMSSIPSNYASIQIRVLGKAASVANFGGIWSIQFNNDTGANYVYAGWNSPASTPVTMIGTSQNSIGWQGVMPLNGSSITNMWGAAIIDINNYASTSLEKSTKTIAGWCGRNIDIGYTSQTSGLWQSTSAINSISFIHNNTWLAGTKFAIYGIKDS